MPSATKGHRAGASGVLGGILSPLRLPGQALSALGSLGEAARHLGPIHAEVARVRELIESTREQVESVPEMLPVVKRISKQAAPLDEMLPALKHLEETMSARLDAVHAVIVALESDQSHLNTAVEDLSKRMDGMHETIRALQDDVQRVTDRMPDPDRGPLDKAKDLVTGGG